MQDTDAVLRTLADRSLEGQRSWANVADLAWAAGVGDKLAYKALARPASIGAVTKHAGGGFSVTDPERVLQLFAARRSLKQARMTTFAAAQSLARTLPEYALGGTRAAAHYLGGTNTIADHAATIIYVPLGVALDPLPPGDTALVLSAGEHELREWSAGYTSKAQTFADLFAQPGWQASAFRRELWRAWFAIDDWARQEVRSA